MRKKPNSLILKIIIALYGVLYFAGFFLPFFTTEAEELKNELAMVEIYTIPAAFLVFLVGAVYVWFNEKVGGIMLLSWHFLVWVISVLFWSEAGMVLVLIFPMFIITVFLILNWHVANIASYRSEIKKWRLVLWIFLINYTAFYLLIVFAEIISRIFGVELRGEFSRTTTWNFNLAETIFLFGELALFIAAGLMTLRSKLYAGILFILWYAILFTGNILISELSHSGPWAVFSFPVFIQGVLYIALYYKEKEAGK